MLSIDLHVLEEKDFKSISSFFVCQPREMYTPNMYVCTSIHIPSTVELHLMLIHISRLITPQDI